MTNFTYEYPRPMLTVDCIIICNIKNQNHILLINRKNDPYKDCWALPGGFVDMDEDLDDAAYREVLEETNIQLKSIQQLFTIGTPGRDPRGRTVSIIYYALVNIEEAEQTKAGDDAALAQWFEINKLPQLAFDHNLVVEKALEILNLRD